MSPKELRIGNFVQTPDGIGTVMILSEYSASVNVMDCISNFNHFAGIPITPEWLEQLGFEKDQYNVYRSPDTIEFRPLIYDNGIIGYELYRGAVDWLRHIEYVHQLQNLYFALTKKELTWS